MSKAIIHGIPRCARLSYLLRQADARQLDSPELIYDPKSRQQGLSARQSYIRRTANLEFLVNFVKGMTGQTQPCPAVPETDIDPNIELTELVLYITFDQQAVKGSADKPKKAQHKLVWNERTGWEHLNSELVEKASPQKAALEPPKVTGTPPRSLALRTHRPGVLCRA